MSLPALAHHMAATGRGPDSMLVHMSPREVHGLQALAMAHGGTLTINPHTGLPEAGFLDSLLPALAGFALNTFVPGLGEAVGGMFGLGGAAGTGIAVGGATALASGDLGKGLMAGLGAYGGAGIGGSLEAAGKTALDGSGFVQAPGEAGRMAAMPAVSPVGTYDRLKAGMDVASAAPTDFMKSNLMNLGFAAAPALSGAFDEQSTSSGSKIHPGYIRVFKTDPVTGRSYQTEAVRADEWGGRPAIEWGGVPPVQRYDDGGTTTDETKKGVPVWGSVGQVELPVYTPEYAMLSDSEKAQRYLMGEGPNPFLFYHKPPVVDPVRKAAEATKEMAKVVEEQRRGGDRGATSFEPGAGLAQFGGSGFTGATTNKYGDSGPTTGLASLANKSAAYLGNLGILSGFNPKTGAEYGLSKAIAQNVDPNYGHEAAVGIRQAAANVMANAPDQSQAETARLMAKNVDTNYGNEGKNAPPSVVGDTNYSNEARNYVAPVAVSSPVTYSPIVSSDIPSNDNYSNEARNYVAPVAVSSPVTYSPIVSSDIASNDNYSNEARNYVAPVATVNDGGFNPISGYSLAPTLVAPTPVATVNDGGFNPISGYSIGPAPAQNEAPAPAEHEYSAPDHEAPDHADHDGGDHDGGGGGGGDARGGFLNHGRFDQRYAYGGGITALADGGMYNLGSYSDGGRLLRGPGDGVSDDIPATIGEKQPARLADGEFVVPARIVSELGNGSTEAGARKLYQMMDRVQKARTKTVGKNKVAANTRAEKYLPA